MTMPAGPFHRYLETVGVTAGGGAPLISAGQFSPAYFVLEGIDLVNDPVTEGQSATVTLQQSGPAGEEGAFFQAIVYATSQGYFPWRGSMVIFPNFAVNAQANAGEWFFTLWGHSEPAYGSFS